MDVPGFVTGLITPPHNDGETKPVSTEELSALTFASATLLFAKHSYAVLQGGRAGVAKR